MGIEGGGNPLSVRDTEGGDMATRERIALHPQARRWLQQPNFAFLTTLMDDGSPHVSPVWVDVEGDDVVVNTAEGGLKAENVHRDPRVALSLSPPDNPYAHLDVRGRVVELIGGEDAEAHIHRLHRKYHGGGSYPLRPGEQRLKIVIAPLAVKLAA
jgi:PPOX class probable F420-dependent enzyme